MTRASSGQPNHDFSANMLDGTSTKGQMIDRETKERTEAPTPGSKLSDASSSQESGSPSVMDGIDGVDGVDGAGPESPPQPSPPAFEATLDLQKSPGYEELLARAVDNAQYWPVEDLSAVLERAKHLQYPVLSGGPTWDDEEGIVWNYEGGFDGFSYLSYDYFLDCAISLLQIVVYMERAGLDREDCGAITRAYEHLWRTMAPDNPQLNSTVWLIPWSEAFLLAVRCGFADKVYPLFETGQRAESALIHDQV